MDNAVDGGSQSFAVPAVQLGKGVMAPARNTSHQHLIRRRCYSRLIKSGPNHTRQACIRSVDPGARRCVLLGPLCRQWVSTRSDGNGRLGVKRHCCGVDRQPSVGQHNLSFPPGKRRMSTCRPLNFLPQKTQSRWSSSDFQLLEGSPTRKIESRSSRLI